MRFHLGTGAIYVFVTNLKSCKLSYWQIHRLV